MCILLYVKLMWCSSIPYIYGHLGGYIFMKYMCLFLYVRLIGAMVIHRSIVNWRKGGLGICAFCYTWNFYGVAVFHTSMVNWRGYICPMYMCILVFVTGIWCSSIPYMYDQLEGYICPKFMFIPLYVNVFGVVVFHTSIVNSKKGGLGICAFCYMWNLCGVAVFHTSMVNGVSGTLP